MYDLYGFAYKRKINNSWIANSKLYEDREKRDDAMKHYRFSRPFTVKTQDD